MFHCLIGQESEKWCNPCHEFWPLCLEMKNIYDFLFRMKQYYNRAQGLEGLHESLVKQLNDVEKKLVASQEVLEIRGKVSSN